MTTTIRDSSLTDVLRGGKGQSWVPLWEILPLFRNTINSKIWDNVDGCGDEVLIHSEFFVPVVVLMSWVHAGFGMRWCPFECISYPG